MFLTCVENCKAGVKTGPRFTEVYERRMRDGAQLDGGEEQLRRHTVQGTSFQEFTTKLERRVVERGEPKRIPQVFIFFQRRKG